MDSPSSSSRSAASGESSRINGDFISVGDALKLIPQFEGDKQEVLAFRGNVDTAFAVINPSQEAILYKFVLKRIIGEPRTAISHRNHKSWAKLKEFLQNTYIEERTLDFHANQPLKAMQGKDENWRTGSTKFRPWGCCFVKPHCSIAEKGCERVYWICPTGYAKFALFRH